VRGWQYGALTHTRSSHPSQRTLTDSNTTHHFTHYSNTYAYMAPFACIVYIVYIVFIVYIVYIVYIVHIVYIVYIIYLVCTALLSCGLRM